jgi:hypothetical protein
MPRTAAALHALLCATIPALAGEPTSDLRVGLPALAKADPECWEAFLIARRLLN